MPFNKKSYNPIWESKYNWLDTVQSDIYAARCKICKKNFLISNSGVGQVKRHAESSKHKSFVGSGTGRQLTFNTSANGLELNNTGNIHKNFCQKDNNSENKIKSVVQHFVFFL